jgi:hypothetical protein
MIDIKLLEKKSEDGSPSYLELYKKGLTNRGADPLLFLWFQVYGNRGQRLQV